MFGVLFLFFFFKQKTAYDMRISDWSSDVCSSDLIAMGEYAAFRGGRIAAEDDEQIGPVDIGNGNFPFIAEHQHGGKILGMLVDREIGRASCRERVCQYV